MPRGRGKGGNKRKKAKNLNVGDKRELIFKEEGQEYAQVLALKGDGRLEANCFDGKKRMCHIRGKLKNRVWIYAGDIILIGLRDFQDDKADVIMKYYEDEARELKAYGELPEHAKINDANEYEEVEDDIEFKAEGKEEKEGEEEEEEKKEIDIDDI